MARKHLKRITAPASWMVERKERKFIARPKGSFSMEMGMPLITVLREVLKLVSTRKEGKRVLNSKDVLVNGIRRKSEKFMAGLMDVLSIKELGNSYRILLDANGILRLVPVSGAEVSVKPCKITGKRTVAKGIIQLSLHDGRTSIGDSAHMTGDTIMVSLPDWKIRQHLKLESGSYAYITGGSNVGKSGVIDNISGGKVTVRIGDRTIEAAKRFVFVVGKEKPLVNIP